MFSTGLAESTIRKYIKDEDPVQSVVRAVHKETVGKSVSVVTKLDDFDEGVVRRTIHGFYRNKELVTMPKLHAAHGNPTNQPKLVTNKNTDLHTTVFDCE